MSSSVVLKWLEAVIPPAAFLSVLWVLLSPKYSRRFTRRAAAGLLAAISAAQIAVLPLGQGPDLAFTLFPLTVFLPAIACLHLLSKNRFLPTAITWLLALLCNALLTALRKLLTLFSQNLEWTGWEWVFAGVLLAAGLLLLPVFRKLREPFQACMERLEGGWQSLFFLPLVLLTLYSYLLSGTADAVTVFLLLFTCLAAFWALARLIISLAEENHAWEYRRRMEAMRQDYEVLQKKLALGRSYRHDMRHHMTALAAMLQQGDAESARRYVANLQGQLVQIETETWCRNAAVNGVLSAYLSQARDLGCELEVSVSLPGELPFEEVDLCMVLANALENAIRACGELPEGEQRYIRLSAALADRNKLTIYLQNPCAEDVKYDSDGFPDVPRREGHGQGLRSIAAVAEKYHGLFLSDCSGHVFTLRVALLDGSSTPGARPARLASAICAGTFLCIFLLNCTPVLAQALETVPVLGSVIRVADLRTWSLRWGGTGISVRDPVLEGDGPAVDELNQQKDDFIAEMEAEFIQYAAQKYQGYAAQDVAYEVVRDDDSLFTIRFRATLNAGGSVDYSRYVSLDKASGQILSLSGLFLPESNYIFPISREIKAQMAEQNNAGKANYFLPGGIWPDEDCFQSIAPDQDFYVNENGQLVIVFGEYEVAPGSMGTPEFAIPTDLLDGLLVQPSVLM